MPNLDFKLLLPSYFSQATLSHGDVFEDQSVEFWEWVSFNSY
jgi:hypothetical protein